MRKIEGFHLIELLITLVLISILVLLSVPIYSQYLLHERRLEAAKALATLALALETYHLEHNTYANADFKTLQVPESIAHHAYHLSISNATQTTYLLKAEPQGKQALHDTACKTLTLDAKGNRDITGNGNVESCW